MEERRLLVAVVLSLLVLYGYYLLFPPHPAAPGAAGQASPAPGAAASAPPTPAPVPSVPATPVPEATTASPLAVPTVAAEEEKRVEVVAPSYTVAFSNRGARLLTWKLAKYRNLRGRPEDMVPEVAASGPHPLDMETGDAALDARLAEALFVPSTELLRVEGGAGASLRFEYADGEVEAEKTLTFRDPGLVDVSARVRRRGEPVACRLTWGPGLGNPTEAERSVRGYQEPHGVALVGRSVERYPAKKLGSSGQEIHGATWVGIESQYFAALFIRGGSAIEAQIRSVSQPSPLGGEPVVAAQALVSAEEGVRLYVGAKDHQALQRLGYGLQKVVPVGEWIGPVAVLLMRLLRWVHGHVGNWGWAIVLVTLLINVVMAPLRHYSIANSLKMARMAPEMKVVQERYRKVPLMDPRRQQMQEEMGALYARHGMSMGTQMLVGCLPLLITMPFLIAFYRVLAVSVELRGAPFLWITDLSQKDPLYLTPVLMGVSMYAMQKMTPTTMDPAQQRMMMLMPVVLAGMFLWAPAGLNLYWLTANLWSIFQQVVEMRVLRPAPAAAPTRKKERKKR